MRAAPWLVVVSAIVACADDGGAPRGEVAPPAPPEDASLPVTIEVDRDESAPEVDDVPKAARPGPYRARGAAAVEANAACEGCHPVEAKEWRASRHRRAETNPAYRRAFAMEP